MRGTDLELQEVVLQESKTFLDGAPLDTVFGSGRLFFEDWLHARSSGTLFGD